MIALILSTPDPTCHLALTSSVLEARPHSKAYLRDIPSWPSWLRFWLPRSLQPRSL